MIIRWTYGNKAQSGQYYSRVPFIQARILGEIVIVLVADFIAPRREESYIALRREETTIAPRREETYTLR